MGTRKLGEKSPRRILHGRWVWGRGLPGEGHRKNVPESWGRHLPGEFSMEMVTEKGTPNVGVGGEVSQETVAKNSLRELREDSLKRESLSLGYF